jgi:DNA mismatch endonuclease (patch repair protein)
VAVLIDGCFWHGCPQHHTTAKTNAQFWAAKVAANRARDIETRNFWEIAGWTVVRFWEHEDIADVCDRIADLVRVTPALGPDGAAGEP